MKAKPIQRIAVMVHADIVVGAIQNCV